VVTSETSYEALKRPLESDLPEQIEVRVRRERRRCWAPVEKQTKLVEGQENPLPIIATAKLNEVQQYCSMSNHVWDGYWILANRRAFQRLPKDVQDVVLREFTQAGRDERADIARLTDTLRQELAGKGLKFIDPYRDAFREKLKTTSFYKDWRAKFGDEGWKLLEDLSGPLT
jgi:TRAP-type C4-dicarboxylate transport system substrate-binding protein